MSSTKGWKIAVAGLGLALLASACNGSSSSTIEPTVAPTATSAEAVALQTEAPTASCPTEGEEWETAKLYIEHNATDADTGVHGLFGGSAWSELCIWDPTGRPVLVVDPLEELNALTVADLFFESREPPNSEYAIADLQAAFPEGEYRVSGTDFEGTPRVGSALFTHAVPTEPTITSPVLADDAETAGDAIVIADSLVITWDAVTQTIDGEPLVTTGYEVIVTQEEFDDPNGFSRPTYDVHVPATMTSLSVPAEFLQPDTVYELEVLALEESGNQTISIGFFATE